MYDRSRMYDYATPGTGRPENAKLPSGMGLWDIKNWGTGVCDYCGETFQKRAKNARCQKSECKKRRQSEEDKRRYDLLKRKAELVNAVAAGSSRA